MESRVDRSWLARVGPWVGIGTSPAAIMTGGGVGQGLRGAAAVAAILVGVALLALLAVGQGLIGQRTGLTLGALAMGPLGARGGRRTASVVMLVMMVGWFGVNVGVGGVALARLLGTPDLAGIAAFSVLMPVVARLGLGALSWSALAAGVATTCLAVWGLNLAVADRPLTLSGGAAGEQPLGFAAAVALVVGYGAAFALRTPDFTHDLARARQVVWCAAAGLVAPLIAFALAGAVLYAVTGTWDLADVLRDLGSPELAYVFVAVGFTGSVLTNVWSGGLSLSDVVPGVPPGAAMALVAGAGAAVAAAGVVDRMLDWLTLMALAAPGLAAVCAVHVGRRLPSAPGWGLAGLGSWAAGFACAVALDVGESALALPAAVVIPAVAYGLLGRGGDAGRV